MLTAKHNLCITLGVIISWEVHYIHCSFQYHDDLLSSYHMTTAELFHTSGPVTLNLCSSCVKFNHLMHHQPTV